MWGWKKRCNALDAEIIRLTEEIAALQRESASFAGRLRAAENQAHAAMQGGERIETRLRQVENWRERTVLNAIAAPDPLLPSSDEDAELPLKNKTCSTCGGKGAVGGGASGFGEPKFGLAICPSCQGKGHLEVIPG
jgi:hypothetical protein